MARQQQEWAKTKGTFSCAPSATQACKSSVQDSQASLHEIGACSLLCNSSNWASSMYEHSGDCRRSWDDRVYHRPSLLGTTSRRQRKHSHTESIRKQTAARCYGCWIHRSQPVVGSSSQSCSQNEELELVSLLQDVSDFWSPEGWLPVPQGSKSGRSQRTLPAKAFYPSERHTHQASRKRSSSSMEPSMEPSIAGQKHVHVPHADTLSQCLPARQISTRKPACESRQCHDTAEYGNNSVKIANTCRASYSVPEPTGTPRGGDISRAEAASLPAVASHPVHVSQTAAAVETDAACDSQEAPAVETDSAPTHDNHEAAVATDAAAAMAAWLIQKPALLHGILGHLESLAASAVSGSSTQTPAPNPDVVWVASSTASDSPAGLIVASSNTRDKPSPPGTCDAQHQSEAFVTGLQAAHQPASRNSAGRQGCCQQAAALPLQEHADAYPGMANNHKPQSQVLSQHRASADAEVQQSGNGSQQPSHSKAGVCGLDQLDVAYAVGQQQYGAWQCCRACSSQSDAGEWQASCQGASCTQPVQLTCRALLEHCAAGRYDEARMLLREYGEVDTTDVEGNTALMLASKAGHGRLVKLLVRKGAKLDALNAEGKSAEQLAIACEHNGIACFLRESCNRPHLQTLC